MDIAHLLNSTEWQLWLQRFRHSRNFEKNFTTLAVNMNQLESRCRKLEQKLDDSYALYMQVIDRIHDGLHERNQLDRNREIEHNHTVSQLQNKNQELEIALTTIGSNLDLLRSERDSYLQEIQSLSDERDAARDGYECLLDDTTGEINHLRFELERVTDEANNMQLKHADQTMRLINDIDYLNQQVQKAKDFFTQVEIGHGDDPVGFLVASHRYMAAERNQYRQQLLQAIEFIKQMANVDQDTPDRTQELTAQALAVLANIQKVIAV